MLLTYGQTQLSHFISRQRCPVWQIHIVRGHRVRKGCVGVKMVPSAHEPSALQQCTSQSRLCTQLLLHHPTLRQSQSLALANAPTRREPRATRRGVQPPAHQQFTRRVGQHPVHRYEWQSRHRLLKLRQRQQTRRWAIDMADGVAICRHRCYPRSLCATSACRSDSNLPNTASLSKCAWAYA